MTKISSTKDVRLFLDNIFISTRMQSNFNTWHGNERKFHNLGILVTSNFWANNCFNPLVPSLFSGWRFISGTPYFQQNAPPLWILHSIVVLSFVLPIESQTYKIPPTSTSYWIVHFFVSPCGRSMTGYLYDSAASVSNWNFRRTERISACALWLGLRCCAFSAMYHHQFVSLQ